MNLEGILGSSIPFILSLQSLGEGFVATMKLFTFLGNEEFYFILFPILFWCVDSRLGLRAGLILLLSGCINSYFKWIFRLPRPYWTNGEVIAHTSETSCGAPSGHSQNAVAMWGLIAASINKTWAWVAAIFIIFMIGVSRMILGVHFLLDVITGWVIGAILLWVFLRLEPNVCKWVENKSLGVKVGISFLASIGLIAIGALILSALSFWEIPGFWIQNALLATPDGEPIKPLAISGVVSNAAVFFGVSAGYVIMNQMGGFNTKGKISQQVLKYFIGIIGVLVVWRGLDIIFPEGEEILALVFRYIRYGLAGIWISLGAPWVFVRIKLSESAQE
jgi:membrane-associated phospholipid phosphatase